MLRKIPRKRRRQNAFPYSQNLTNAPAKGRDFGLAHTHGSVETTRASGPAPGRTLHTKSGSTGAEGQLAKTFTRITHRAGGLSNGAQFEHFDETFTLPYP